jgi:hypothetical protein
MLLNKKYILNFIILLIVEIIIALFIHDAVIRPYIGDILVVILIYCLVRGFIAKPIKHLHIYIFLFAAAVELVQYFRIVELLNLQNNKAASIMIGTSFDIKDILCYFAASLILVIWERIEKR